MLRRHVASTLCVMLVLAAANSAAPAGKGDGNVVIAGAEGARLDAAVTTAQPEFWGAVLVSRGDEIVLSKGYGASGADARPHTPATLFGIASASKQFTATAIVHLAQRGKLSLDDTLDRFWKKLPTDKHAVTLRHLLTHTSGLSKDLGVAYASPIGREEYVRAMLTPPLVATPGEHFAYNNVGYALLAAVVETVTRKSFEAYCETQLFRPAGMQDTGFIGDRDLQKSGRASARAAPGGPWTAADWHYGWGYRGMGGAVTTVEDLHRWDRALRGDDILDEPHRALLHETAPASGHQYACGWRVDITDRGTTKAHHSGSVAGYGCHLARWLEEDVFVAVLANDPRSSWAVMSALEPLLFEPPQLRLTVDVTGYELSAFRAAAFRTPHLTADHDDDDKNTLVVRLRDGARTPVVLRAPIATARKLAADLSAALRTRADEGGDAPDETTANAYLLPYDAGTPQIELDEGLTIVVRPRYDSTDPTPDLRVTLWIADDARRGMPVLVRLGATHARALRDRLTELAR